MKVFRLDERLIHGQVMTSWIGYTGATEIIIVDDEIAQDDFMKLVLTQAAPKNIETKVMNCKQFTDYDSNKDNKNRIILFKKLIYVKELLDMGTPISELSLGNMGSSPQRKKYANSIYMTDGENDLIEEIQKSGCQVFIQMLPNDLKKKI